MIEVHHLLDTDLVCTFSYFPTVVYTYTILNGCLGFYGHKQQQIQKSHTYTYTSTHTIKKNIVETTGDKPD